MKIKTFLSILGNPTEFFLIIRITGFLFALPARLRFNTVHNIVSVITPKKTVGIGRPLTLDRVIYICETILRELHRIRYRYSCLRRSLLLYHFLRYYQVPVLINFGVKWEGERLTGHSWLTLDDELYLEPEEKASQFTRLFSLPTERAEAIAGEKPLEGELSKLNEAAFD